jgi:hypothetical protein
MPPSANNRAGICLLPLVEQLWELLEYEFTAKGIENACEKVDSLAATFMFKADPVLVRDLRFYFFSD